MPTEDAFRALLVDLAHKMSEEDREDFVFLLGNDIPKIMKTNRLVHIFDKLIDGGFISEEDGSYLERKFKDAKLLSLAYDVARFYSERTPRELISTASRITQPESCTPCPSAPVDISTQQENSTSAELRADWDETDAAIIDSFVQITPPTTSTDISPIQAQLELPKISVSLENIDLEIFAFQSWSNEFLKKIQINIPPYEYQRELVQSAIAAGNTIVCLRSGGGKTFVAALLIKYYLLKKLTQSNGINQKFLAFLIVPRRAMLKQQVDKLVEFANIRVIQCDEYVDPVQYIGKYDVIACTPQKLLNCLNSKTIFLNDIDLICFDECHDSASQNQYVGIMQYLLCNKIDSFPPVTSPPVIIGLTAAIGFQRSNATQIYRNLMDLCAKFNCSTITTVSKREHEDELDRCVNHISDDEIICVEKKRSYESLRLKIEKELRDFILQLFIDKETNPSQIFPERDIGVNGYEQDLELLKQEEEKHRNSSFVFLINYVLPIYRHLKGLIDLTPELVLSNLKNEFDQTYRKREHPMDIDTLIYEKCQSLLEEKINELDQSEEIVSNPKLDKLAELLKKYLEKAENKILILVERTFYAQKICEYLRAHSELKNIVKPCWLVGQNSTGLKRLNKKEDSVLKDFRNGTCNVLISTDIIQAGLDIPQCSLVLRYDFVPDSFGTIQARVRARTNDCKYCLITTTGSANYSKENDNHECERALQSALDAWKQCPIHQFKEQVLEMKNSLINEWTQSLTKKFAIKSNTSKNTELNGEVLCRTCNYVLGKLSALRQSGVNYFINDRDFYNRIEERKQSEPEEYTRTLVLGKTLCGSKDCRAELGRIVAQKDQPKMKPFYPLKCASIKIRLIQNDNDKEEILSKKHWSHMPFQIVSLIDLNTETNDEIFYDAWDTFVQ